MATTSTAPVPRSSRCTNRRESDEYRAAIAPPSSGGGARRCAPYEAESDLRADTNVLREFRLGPFLADLGRLL